MIKALQSGTKLLNENYKEELRQEGHTLTGALERSIRADIRKTSNGYKAEGQALSYQEYVEDGFPASSASFRQFPFLVEYFQKRGKDLKEAKAFAAATIRKWMKEGMPTAASRRFSNNGRRTKGLKAVHKAYTNQVDEAILNGIQHEVDKTFHKTKSETI